MSGRVKKVADDDDDDDDDDANDDDYQWDTLLSDHYNDRVV